MFPRLFRISRNLDWSVADAKEVDWQLDFRRRLGNEEVAEWNDLQEALDDVEVTREEDKVFWTLTPSGKFTTKSIYRLIKNSGEVDTRMIELWQTKIPLKVKIFLWMLWHDRILTGDQFKIRKGKGSEKCKYCGKLETRNHFFFNCTIAQIIWVWVRVSMRWLNRLTSIQHFEDMMGIGSGNSNNMSSFFILASISWSLWKTRNNWVFNDVLVRSPKAIAHMIMGFLSQWMKLLKPADRLKMEDTIAKLKEGLNAW